MKVESLSMEATPRRMVTKEEIAEFLNVQVRTIENWMARGWIPYRKIGRAVRFDLPEVQRAVRQRFGKNLV